MIQGEAANRKPVDKWSEMKECVFYVHVANKGAVKEHRREGR